MKTKVDTIFENEFIQIGVLRHFPWRETQSLMIAFSSFGTGGMIYNISYEFVSSSFVCDAGMFVIDKTRSFGQNLNYYSLAEIIFREFPKVSRMYSVGFSMGGFTALFAGPLIGCRTTISFSPGLGIHPSIRIGEECQLIEHFRSMISSWSIVNISEALIFPGTRNIVFHGEEEVECWASFPQHPTISHFIVHKCGHNTAPKFKQSGCLKELIRTACSKKYIKNVESQDNAIIAIAAAHSVKVSLLKRA